MAHMRTSHANTCRHKKTKHRRRHKDRFRTMFLPTVTPMDGQKNYLPFKYTYRKKKQFFGVGLGSVDVGFG